MFQGLFSENLLGSYRNVSIFNHARFYLKIVQDFTNYSFLTETRNKHITVSRGFKKMLASPAQIPGYTPDLDIYVF